MTHTELMQSAKPILFNTEMVRAILDGIKTVTRQVLKNQDKYAFAIDYNNIEFGFGEADLICECDGKGYALANKPPYYIGDILYVRETWCVYDNDHVIDGVKFAYKADATPVSEEARKELGYKWKPSIQMPKEAARIFLRVTNVRVEHLQNITADDIRKEGLPSMAVHVGDMEIAQAEFKILWNSTVKKSDLDRYGWTANPWVWVIEFERVEESEVNING